MDKLNVKLTQLKAIVTQRNKQQIMTTVYASVLNSNTSSGNNCPICHVVCGNEEDIKTFVQRSIGCDGCNAWFHFSCIEMTAKKLKEMGENNWFCTVCAVEMEN